MAILQGKFDLAEYITNKNSQGVLSVALYQGSLDVRQRHPLSDFLEASFIGYHSFDGREIWDRLETTATFARLLQSKQLRWRCTGGTFSNNIGGVYITGYHPVTMTAPELIGYNQFAAMRMMSAGTRDLLTIVAVRSILVPYPHP